jgi:hypothetical protein
MLPAHYKYRPSFGLPHVSPCRKQVAALTGMRRLQTLNLQRSCCAAEGIARHDRLTTSSSRNPGGDLSAAYTVRLSLPVDHLAADPPGQELSEQSTSADRGELVRHHHFAAAAKISIWASQRHPPGR